MPKSTCKRGKPKNKTTTPVKRKRTKSSRPSTSIVDHLPNVEYYQPGKASYGEYTAQPEVTAAGRASDGEYTAQSEVYHSEYTAQSEVTAAERLSDSEYTAQPEVIAAGRASNNVYTAQPGVTVTRRASVKRHTPKPEVTATDLAQPKVSAINRLPYVVDGEDQRMSGVASKHVPILKRAQDTLNMVLACRHTDDNVEVKAAVKDIKESVASVQQFKSDVYRFAAEISLAFEVTKARGLMNRLTTDHNTTIQALELVQQDTDEYNRIISAWATGCAKHLDDNE